MSESSGSESQLTGDRAEAKVRDTLLDAGLFCSKFEKDRGEDLLVELDGYAPRDSGSIEPRIGLLQIKGHEADGPYTSADGFARRVLRVEKLQRWSAYPLPVFVVAVNIHGTQPRFFAQSIDAILAEATPHGLGSLDQDTITVRVPYVDDLSTFVSTETAHFYSAHAFKLTGISDSALARNHYEVLSTKTSPVPPSAKVWLKYIRVLWKGPWRPAHFWATVNHIADSQQSAIGKGSVPLLATFHIYRSLKDSRDNNAVAHVSWLEDKHPKLDEIRELTNWPRAKHFLRFRFNGVPNLDKLPDSYAIEVPDDEFLQKASVIWSQLDTICNQMLSQLSKDLRVDPECHQTLEITFNAIDDDFNQNLGSPSPQFLIIDKMLSHYISEVGSVLFWLKGKDGVSESTRRRWLRGHLVSAAGCNLAFGPLSKILIDG